jgi:hypothetical protein
MNYTEWQDSVPESITTDSLWKMTAYYVLESELLTNINLVLKRDYLNKGESINYEKRKIWSLRRSVCAGYLDVRSG